MSNTHAQLDERQFLVAVRRLADTLATGADVSPYVGSGVDYVQSRPYSAGDPTRAIDWRVTARTGQTFVKQYESPKRLAIHCLVDASGSMRLGSGAKSKFDWAVMLAGALSLAALNQQNPVGLHATAIGAAALLVRPTLSRDRVHLWTSAMRGLSDADRPNVTIDTALARVDVSATERGAVVVLSDLHEANAIPALKRLAGRHDLLVLRLTDAAEARPTGGGIFRAAEAETGLRFLGVGHRPPATFADGRSPLAAAGVDCIDLCVGDRFLPRLQMFLKARKRARGR